MGTETNISYEEYPKQTDNVGQRVEVCYHYDASKRHHGTIIRDDAEAPGRMIFRLDNGRVLLSTECMYSYKPRQN